MKHDEEKFTPETVDEQIEQLAQMPIRGQKPLEADAHLVKLLQHIYQANTSSSQADHASLERIKQRIDYGRHRLATHVSQMENIEVPRSRQGRNKRMNISSEITKTPMLYRRFSMIAATLILALLLGSWAVVVHREAQQKTSQETSITPAGSQQLAAYALSYRTLYKLNPQNGTILWKQKLKFDSYAKMAYANGIVYVSSIKDGIEAINAQNGFLLWYVPDDQQGPISVVFTLSVANNLVYIVRGAHIAAFDARSGTQRWVLQTLSFPLQGIFKVENSNIYIDNQNTFYAVNALTGRIRWQYRLNGVYNSQVQQANGVVYTPHGSVLFAFRVEDGKLLWQKAVTPPQAFSDLSLIDGIIYADSWDPDSQSPSTFHIHAFNAQDGKPLWTSPTGYQLAPTTSPVDEGVVLANHQFGNNGANALAGFNARTGKQIWQECYGNCSMNVFTIANGVVYSDKEPANAHGSQLLLALDIKTGRELAQYPMTSNSDIEVTNTALYALERFGDATSKPVPDVMRAISIPDSKILWNHTLNNNDTDGPNSDQLIVVP